jgi:hypothetical protein
MDAESMQSLQSFFGDRKRGAGTIYRGEERFLKKTLYLTHAATDCGCSTRYRVPVLLFVNLAA